MDDLDRELDDVVLFELPRHEDVEAFRDRFRPRWEGWSDSDEPVWLFTVQLEQNSDLVSLLGEARGLVGELGLASIRYCLDGRMYVLGAPTRDAAGLVATSTPT